MIVITISKSNHIKGKHATREVYKVSSIGAMTKVLQEYGSRFKSGEYNVVSIRFFKLKASHR